MVRARLAYLACVLLIGTALGFGSDAGDWNQPYGNAAGTSCSELRPVAAPPVEAWRHELGERLSEPVAAGGVVYVVGSDRGRPTLLAFRATTGEELGKKRLARGERFHVVVGQGTVAVVGSTEIRTFHHKNGAFRDRRTIKGSWAGAPAVYRGLLIACDGKRLVNLVDLQRGKIMESIPGGYGRPAVIAGGEGEAVVVTLDMGERTGYVGEWAILRQHRILGIGGRKLSFSLEGSTYGATFASGADASQLAGASVTQVAAPNRYVNGWFVSSPVGMLSTQGEMYSLMISDQAAPDTGLSPIQGSVAVFEGDAFGMSDGHLVRAQLDGRFFNLPDAPPGGLSGPASIAGGVLFMGNWAMELESNRVLWCDEALQPTTPLIPVADRRLVYGTATHELVCLADPSVLEGSEHGSTTDVAATSMPGSDGGVVLADGRHIAGTVELLADGRVRVAPAEGKALELSRGEVALAEVEGETHVLGEHYPIYLAWRAGLRVDYTSALEDVFEQYLKSRFVGDCRRLLGVASDYGLSADGAEALGRRLAGVPETTSSNAPGQRRRLRAIEDEAHEAAVLAIVDAARWCVEHGLVYAAGSLLAEADTILPARELVLESAKACMPSAFPDFDGIGEDERAQVWLRWAEEILPAGAEFVGRDDLFWKKRARRGIWSEAIALRSANLVLLSKEHDPAVVGACLRNGEGAVRALEQMLGPPQHTDAEPERLDVRIHRTREEYLAEEVVGVGQALTWSAGFYSPMEAISRFYVPRAGENTEPLGRGLYQVLVHELTHHYIDRRWAARKPRSASQPGYWIVEGIARFVEDQVVEMGRLGTGFDDPTVRSLDAATQIEKQGGLIPLADFVDLPQTAFAAFGTEPVATVQLRNTLVGLQLSTLSIFYEQAGSLVFFLMNRCGPEKRALLLDYLRRHYGNEKGPPGWEQLGFASAAEMEQEFHAFLQGL